MHLTTWLPFWQSLDSVRRVHNDLELTSVGSFALLALFDALSHWANEEAKKNIFGEIGVWCFIVAVLCEGIAYPYGRRNDTLSERIIVSLSTIAE